MTWQAITVLVWMGIEMGYSIAKHGQARTYDAPSAIICVIVLLSLLSSGGFFS